MSVDDHDSGDLAELGYRQELRRSLGGFSTFAASFSVLSVLTGLELFYIGFGSAGPAWIWAWVAIYIGQFFVALNFAELAAHYPLAGSIYNWSKSIAPRSVSWFAAYLWTVELILATGGIALFLQIILPSIDHRFQFIGNGSGTSVAENAVLLGGIALAIATVINAIGIRFIRLINNVGVAAELGGLILLIVALAIHAQRGPEVVFRTNGMGAGHSLGYLGALLMASLVGAYGSIGFDTAASLAEETHEPRRHGPRAVLRSVAAAGIGGSLLVLVAEMAVHNISAKELSVEGLPFVIKDALGGTVGTLFLVDVAIAIFVCVIVVQSAAIRMIFGMARDNRLPFSRQLARIDDGSHVPVVPAVLVGMMAFAFLLVNLKQPQIIAAVSAVSSILAFLAYLGVIVPLAVKRRRGWPAVGGSGVPGLFSLGRWSMPVNVIAGVFLAGVAVYLMIPQKAIYNAVPPFHWYLQWSPLLFVAIIVAIGALYYALAKPHRRASLAEHQAGPSDPQLTDRAPDPQEMLAR